MSTLAGLYVDQLRDVYDARLQLVRVFPKMATAANDKRLGHAFREQAARTRSHISHLKQIFRSLKEKPAGRSCIVVRELVEEFEDQTMASSADARYSVDRAVAVIDCTLIAHAWRIERYIVTSCTTICTYAEMLNRREDMALLRQTLSEDRDAHDVLKSLMAPDAEDDAARRAQRAQPRYIAAFRVPAGSAPLRI